MAEQELTEKIWLICQDVRLGNLSESEATELIEMAIKEAGYVKLAEDQSLPLSGPYSLREAKLVRQARSDMLKVTEGKAFRKVELST